MPILNYRCEECGKEFSKIFFNQEYAPRKCPVCGTEHLSEVGPAFEADERSTARTFGVSCAGCGDDSCGSACS
jgi:putative FmdB family regulatory protein